MGKIKYLRKRVHQTGTSNAVILPAYWLKQLGIGKGSEIYMLLTDNVVVIFKDVFLTETVDLIMKELELINLNKIISDKRDNVSNKDWWLQLTSNERKTNKSICEQINLREPEFKNKLLKMLKVTD